MGNKEDYFHGIISVRSVASVSELKKGDTIEVKGSRVAVAGKPVLIAAEVKKGAATLKLRDESGIPVWAGWRK